MEYEKATKPHHKKAEKPPPEFTKKENATLEQRIEILNWYCDNGKNQTKTAKHFNKIYPNLMLWQPRVLKWVGEEDQWRLEWESVKQSTDHTTKKARQTEHPQITEMMDLWVQRALNDGLGFGGNILCDKWNEFANLCQVPEDDCLGLSAGWLDHFKK